MELLVDAQLPQKMMEWFHRYDVIVNHTFNLPDGNKTSDSAVSKIADDRNAVLVSKDSDFVDSHLLYNRPRKLILISTGNISNRELEELICPLIPQLLNQMLISNFIEIGRNGITVRG